MTDTLERRAQIAIEEVLLLPEADRFAAAEKACGDDPALLGRVRSLLSGAPMAGGFMSDPTIDAPAEVRVTERPGTVIGRYKLLQQIGEGGFGVVFMAEQEKPVRRQVAVKVIKLGMDTREVVARFEAERQALALMDHPNIAKVLDAGSTETGRPFFVMELVRGSPITEYADKHKLSTRDRIGLATQVCRAVQHAHGKGVIHRDLKPNNVLVTVTDDKPVPKVIDFGIAKATQSKLTDRTLFTAYRQMIGTPQYMSPEQADSDGSDVDTRTDVYSLGVLLYELLVGTTPFDAKSLRSAAYDEMRRIIRDQDVPHPSTKLYTMAVGTMTAVASNRSTDGKRLSQSVKGELDWIVMRALEKDRTRRYDTAAALADDLNRYLAGEAVQAGPVSGVYRLKKTLNRYRAAVVVGGTIAACLLLGVAGTTYGLVRAKRDRDEAFVQRNRAEFAQTVADQQRHAAQWQQQIAQDRAKEATDQRNAAQATLDFLTQDVLAKASPKETRDSEVSRVLVESLVMPALRTIDQRFVDQPLVRAGIQHTLAATLIELGRPDLAEAPAKAAWTTRKRLLGDEHFDTLSALSGYAGALAARGRWPDAERLFKQVWDARRRLLGDKHPSTLSSMGNYAWMLDAQGRHAEAEQLDKQLWDAQRRRVGDDHPETMTAMNNYAAAIEAQGRHAEAEQLDRQQWETQRRIQGDDHPATLMALLNYAATVAAQGRSADAEKLLEPVWKGSRHVLGDDHPDTLRALNFYVTALVEQGHYAEAERLSKQLLDTSRRVLGEDDTRTLVTLCAYASAIDGQGRYAEAERLGKQLLDTRRRVSGDDDRETLTALNNYANEIDSQGRHPEAEQLYKQAWEGSRRVRGPDHPTTLTALQNYAWAIDAQGRHAEAERLSSQAWDAYRRTLGEDHPDTLAAMFKYALAVDHQGRPARVEPLWQQLWTRSRRVLGEDHPFTLVVLEDYATAVNAQGRHAEAEPMLRRAADLFRQSDPDDDSRGPTLYKLGQTLAGLQKWPEAEAVARENYAWDQTHAAPDRKPGTVPGSLRLLNRCLKAQGKPTESTTLPTTAPTTRP